MENSDLYNAIWKRRSVRKYLEKQIDEDKIRQLEGTISALNELSGLNIEFIENSDAFRSVKAVRFKNVRSVIVIKGRTNDPDRFEKCGYYGEQIILEATALGLGTCWVAVSYSKSSLKTKDDEDIVCVISIGYGAEGISGSADVPDAPHRKTISISEFLDGSTDVPDWVTAAMKAVQFAPTALNSQKARFKYADGTLSVMIPSSRIGTTDKLNLIDLGIIKLHFELAAGGRFSSGTPGEFVKDQ